MTQEEKELLLKDLCARIPYNTIVHLNLDGGQKWQVDAHISKDIDDIFYILETQPERVKPYLRPMSSMTEEEFTKLKEYSGLKYDQLDLVSFQNGAYKILDFYLNEVPSGAVIRVFDWLNKYHFDYRDLIQMGLAIAVTTENNPYKE